MRVSRLTDWQYWTVSLFFTFHRLLPEQESLPFSTSWVSLSLTTPRTCHWPVSVAAGDSTLLMHCLFVESSCEEGGRLPSLWQECIMNLLPCLCKLPFFLPFTISILIKSVWISVGLLSLVWLWEWFIFCLPKQNIYLFKSYLFTVIMEKRDNPKLYLNYCIAKRSSHNTSTKHYTCLLG